MKTPIIVGFGTAQLLCDDEVIYDENQVKDPEDWSDYMTVAQAELLAMNSPSKSWKIIMNSPLYGGTWEWKSKENWVLIEKNEGFA